jgi:hypothetical protein
MERRGMRWFAAYGKMSLVVLLLSSALVSCHGKTAPDSIIGRWVTDDDRYRECALEIEASSIAFRNAEGGVDSCPIRKVVPVKKDSSLEVTIDYSNADKVVYTTTFIWSPDGGGTLRAKNQQNIAWRHAERDAGPVSSGPQPSTGAAGGASR